jgi:biotin carboxyl carrier protein
MSAKLTQIPRKNAEAYLNNILRRRDDNHMQYRVTVNGKIFDVSVELVSEAVPTQATAPTVPTPVPTVPTPAPEQTLTEPTSTPSPAPVIPAVSVSEPTITTSLNDEEVLSPFPGNIIEVMVSVGQSVKMGQCLVILEAMKMENEIVASRDGIVKEVFVKKGVNVNTDDILVVLG